MSEYTPTAEEVRNAWVCCIFESGAWVSDAAYEDARWDEERAEAQFDRWLAAEKAKWQAEAWERGVAAPRMQDGSELPAVDNPYREAA